jgi:hypothetical protein
MLRPRNDEPAPTIVGERSGVINRIDVVDQYVGPLSQFVLAELLCRYRLYCLQESVVPCNEDLLWEGTLPFGDLMYLPKYIIITLYNNYN